MEQLYRLLIYYNVACIINYKFYIGCNPTFSTAESMNRSYLCGYSAVQAQVRLHKKTLLVSLFVFAILLLSIGPPMKARIWVAELDKAELGQLQGYCRLSSSVSCG